MTTQPPVRLAAPTGEPDRLARWALEQVDTGERITAISGLTGAGESRILARMRQDATVLVVEPPPLRDGDAVFHALAQLAATAGTAAEAYEAGASVRERAKSVAQRLAAREQVVLVLRLPSSWNGLDAASGRDQLVFRRRAIELLQGLRDATGLRLVVLATSVDRALSRVLGLHGRVEHAEAPAVRTDALRDETAWGSYATHARRAADLLHAQRATPIEARVLVGCLALGADPEWTRHALASAVPLRPLLSLLASLLRQPEHRDLTAALAPVLTARAELPLDVAEDLAGLPEEHRPLLRDCIGYRTDGGDLRVAEPVRLALGSAAPEAHSRLAEYYGKLDGKRSLTDLDLDHARAWLEKVHHLAHGGPETASRWEEQTRGARELFWDRGRALSIDAELHRLAAEVYRACVERFPDDAYAWHYLGYNLDRAGLLHCDEGLASRKWITAEDAFRKAVRLESDNRWWHSRLITFLVEQARYSAAEAATREALDELDPDGSRVVEDPQLCRDFHRWVVTAWLDAGEIARARQAFNLLPPEVMVRDELLRQLKWRLEDAEEAVELGDSVHPPGVRMDLRWQRPTHVAERGPDGARLLEVHPARVVEGSAEGVTLVVGLTGEGRRELARVELSAEEWQAANAWCPPEGAHGYLYLAYYESGVQRVFLQDEPPPPWEPGEPAPDPLRHLRSWAGGTEAAPTGGHAPTE